MTDIQKYYSRKEFLKTMNQDDQVQRILEMFTT
jgi:hypothetical protein